MDENTRKWYGVAAAIIVVFVAVAWYFSAHRNAVAPSENSTSTATTTGQTGSVQAGVPNNSGYPAPNLDRPYIPPSNLPAEIQTQSKKAVADAVAQLKIDPNHIAYWLQLAVYRKGAGDYVGAEEVWLYCTKVWPTDPISYENLADLYAYHLKQPAKAVEYWNKAIPLDKPNSIRLYVALATFQSINMSDKAAARATLEAGLKANPGNKDIQNALNNL
ncbi:hypothetical protein K2Q08_01080 [Patescibacteria group bacterium]|nr:hypothetical protein [Patescibacteria group bacterium]